MIDRFNLLGKEPRITQEHLQGYLYAQQEIENTVLALSGSQKEYSFYQIHNEIVDSNGSWLASVILDRLKNNETITQAHHNFLVENLIETKLDNWESQLKPILHHWFADKHLSIQHIRNQGNAYQNSFDDWTDQQKETYKRNFDQTKKSAKHRINTSQTASTRFIELLQSLGQLTVFHLMISDESKKNPLYSSYMNFTWGWEFDLLILKGEEETYLLHLAMVLT